MARIEGVDLPRDKRVIIGLTYIFGIGNTTSRRLLDSAGINHSTRVPRFERKRSAASARIDQ